MKLLPVFLLPLLVSAMHAGGPKEVRTLCSYGAAGDGRQDDREAINRALIEANGGVLDGEGKTYAVKGSITVRDVPVHLRNATLVQTMEPLDLGEYFPSVKTGGAMALTPADALIKTVGNLPYLRSDGMADYAADPTLTEEDLKNVEPYLNLCTLLITGSEGKPVAVSLEKIKVMRGDHPDSGSRSKESGGISIEYAQPLDMVEVEVTGAGKGRAIGIQNSSQVRLKRLHIHDIHWAPYRGDRLPSVESVKKDFGWNNFPIYEYNANLRKFVRQRISEQLNGLRVAICEDVTIEDSVIERLGVKIEGQFFPIQADGMTLNRIKTLMVKNCRIDSVWEGIDFTGAGGSDFVFENVETTDCFSFGIKLAHEKQNGVIRNCTSTRSGNAGFVVERGVENVEYVDCRALETGSSGHWAEGDSFLSVAGFRISSGGRDDAIRQTGIRFIDCSAINREFPGKMENGFFCAPDASGPKFQNTVKNCTVEGAAGEPIAGF